MLPLTVLNGHCAGKQFGRLAAEQGGFEPLVPLTTKTLFRTPHSTLPGCTLCEEIGSGPRGDLQFESPFLQRRVSNELGRRRLAGTALLAQNKLSNRRRPRADGTSGRQS
jgi:hypothetical protein